MERGLSIAVRGAWGEGKGAAAEGWTLFYKRKQATKSESVVMCERVYSGSRKAWRFWGEMSTEKYNHDLKVENYLVGMFKTPRPEDNISVALRNLLQGGRRGSQAIYKSATQAIGNLNIKIRYQVKDFSILCIGRCKLLGSVNSFPSYAPQLSGANPVSLFTLRSGPIGRWLLLAFPQLLSNHHGVWQLAVAVADPLDLSFGSPYSLSETRNR